ncbi:MAG: hypothetical protein HUK26_03345 [Duodenibacillus sp.]|nr:hypothetical protein [Duodenibacillus sp.]
MENQALSPRSRRAPLLALTAACALAAAGCSTVVGFESDVSGARVVSRNGADYGTAPSAVRFDKSALDALRWADGCARLPGVVYTWPSGATAESPHPIVLCGSPSLHTVYVKRPGDQPGMEEDLRVALAIERRRAEIAEAEARAAEAHAEFMRMHSLMLSGPHRRHRR